MNLEQLPKDKRRAEFAGYDPEIQFSEKVRDDGSIEIGFVLKPGKSFHPATAPVVLEHFTDAMKMGFRFMRCFRVALPRHPLLTDERFLDSDDNANELFGACARAIETAGCGAAHIQRIAKEHGDISRGWATALKSVPPEAEKAVADAVAEWADGDSIAAHFAYAGDYFCTRDEGKSGTSVLSGANRKWLEADFRLRFVTPEALVAVLGH